MKEHASLVPESSMVDSIYQFVLDPLPLKLKTQLTHSSDNNDSTLLITGGSASGGGGGGGTTGGGGVSNSNNGNNNDGGDVNSEVMSNEQIEENKELSLKWTKRLQQHLSDSVLSYSRGIRIAVLKRDLSRSKELREV